MSEILIPLAKPALGHPAHAGGADRDARDVAGARRDLRRAEGKSGGGRPGTDEAEEHQSLRLRFAGNPFDFHDLLLSGIKDWSKTSDALIDGASVPGVLGLFEAGLQSGRLEMLLLLHHPHVEVPVLLRDEDGLGVPQLEEVGGVHRSAAHLGGSHVQTLQHADQGIHEPLVHGVVAVGALGGLDLQHDSLLSPVSLPQILGFAIVSIQKGWWNGHLLYLKPEHRGKGLGRAYHEETFRMAARARLRGVQAYSSLPAWPWASRIFNRELYLTQENGTPVYRYWRSC